MNYRRIPAYLPKFGWKTNKVRIFFSIIVCAVLGVVIVYFCPGSVWLQMAIAYLISQIILNVSGTSFAPMVSAIVLPVLLQTKSPAYLVSATVFTFLILILRTFLEKSNIKEPIEYCPLKILWNKQQLYIIFKRTITATILIFIGVNSGWRFMVAPPLLVAFTEFSNPESAARKKPCKAVALIGLCALSGSLCRYIITMTLQLPLIVAAVAGSILMLMLIYKFKMFIPPAAAMMLLAMLIPVEAVAFFPFEVAAGMTVLMIADLLLFKGNQNSNDEF